jgi:arginine-tRNA-protein transferase
MAQPDDAELPFSLLLYYATSPYPCSYLPDREARSQVATPAHLIDSEIYSSLVRAGFRRSGIFTYRPHCDHCRACVPVRLPVADLQTNRSQRRAMKRHANLRAREMPLVYLDEHYDLYNRYQQSRHPGGGMDEDSHEQYAQFLLQSRVDTRLIEFRDEQGLRMVSLIDVLDDGLSSVHLLRPGRAGRQLRHLQHPVAGRADQGAWPALSLGYWIAESRKMAYKAAYQPIEGLIDGRWVPLPLPEHA